jgi:uncharacterized protein HemY
MTDYNHKNIASYIVCCFMLVVSACTSIAPVQEMSNARQTLRLAKVTKAEIYAQEKYSKAQEYLDQAVNQLNSGDFTEARRLALQATQVAKQAHLVALTQQKK